MKGNIMIRVYLDNNEKIHGRAKPLEQALTKNFEFIGFKSDLPCDMLMQDECCNSVYVELKLIADLWTSKATGHLGDQIGKLTQKEKPAFVAVFGSVDEVFAETPAFSYINGRKQFRDWKAKSLDMELLRAMAGDAFGCNVPIHFFSKNEYITFKFILDYGKNILEGPDIYQWLPHADRRYAPKSMLCMIPGIKGATANTLLDKFESVQAIANASIEELQTIKGIGPSKAKKIYESFK